MERNIFKLKLMHAGIGLMPASAIWILHFADVAGSIALGTAVFTVSMVCTALLDIPTGVFSDRCGRRAGAIVATSALALALAGYALAPSWQWLFVAALFDGLAMAMISGNNAALLHESLVALNREDEFAHEWGRVQGWFHWLAFPAAIVGSVLATIDLRLAVWASLPGTLLAAAVAFTLKEPVRHVDQAEPLRGHVIVALQLVKGNRVLRYVTAAAVLTGGVGMAMFAVRPLWIESIWPVWAVGAARAGSALFAAIGAWWAGAMIKRLGPIRTIAYAQSVSSVVNIIALVSGSKAGPAVLTTGSMVFGIATTADNTLLQREFSDAQRATMASFVSVGTRLMFALSSLAFALFASSNTMMGLIVAEVVMVLAVGLYIPAARQLSRRRILAPVLAPSR